MLSHTMRSQWMKMSAAACMMMGIAAPVSALTTGSITVDMTSFAGNDLRARAVLEQISDNDIKATLSIIQDDNDNDNDDNLGDGDGDDNTGDWGGFWFNLADDSFLAGLTVAGDDITAYDFSGNVGWVGSHNNNLNGGGSPGLMDAGIAFGQPGSAGGRLKMTMFTLSHDGGLSLSLFSGQIFAGRLTSVGPEHDGGEGSSKVVSGEPIPEPATTTLALMGLGSLALGRRRSH